MTWVAVGVGVVGTAGSIYAGNKASKAAKKLSPTELMLQQQELQNSQSASKYGQAFLDKSGPAIDSAQNFWQRVMSGDRESLASLYGQNIADLGNQSRTAFRTNQELSPRSGVSAQFMSSLPFSRSVQEQNIMSSAKPQAAGALGSIGTNLASLGFSGLGQGTGGASSLLDFNFNKDKYASQQGSDTAASVYNLIKMFGNGVGGALQNRSTAQQNFWNNPNNTNSMMSGAGQFNW